MPASMTPRVRVRRALNHQEPDRVPIDLGATSVTGLTMQAYHNLRKSLNINGSKPVLLSKGFQLAEIDEPLLRLFEVDFRPVFYQSHKAPANSGQDSDVFVDEWGIKRYCPAGGFYYDIVEYPLAEAEIEDLETYPWPDPLAPFRFTGVQERAKDLYEHTDYALVGPGYDGGFFEDAWMMRGFERFLMDLLVDQEFAYALMRKILDLRKRQTGRYLELVGEYLDVVYVADDLAIQTGSLISIETYRSLVKPLQKEYYSFIKERTEAKLFYHCCGNVEPLLEDFIEIGVDIINPVQVSIEGMDTRRLKETYGDRISFWGGIDTQHVLPHGSVEDVKLEVRQRVRELAPGGGFVLAPVHNIQPDVPTKNIQVMYQEAKKVGQYIN
jgi:uroporphyrinogen decarboxylase